MANTSFSNGEELDRKGFALLAAGRGIPEHMCDSIAGYIVGDYKHVGGFLTAVLSNDLAGAFSKADDENRYAIDKYIRFLWNDCPSGCWGSKEAFDSWLSRDREAA